MPTKLTIGLGNRLSGVYMQNSTNTTVKSGKSTIIRNLAVHRHFVAYLVFISSIRVKPGPRNRGPTSLLALKIRTPVAFNGKLRSIGQVPVVLNPIIIRSRPRRPVIILRCLHSNNLTISMKTHQNQTVHISRINKCYTTR